MLAKRFVVDGCGYLRICLGKGKGHAVGHTKILRHGPLRAWAEFQSSRRRISTDFTVAKDLPREFPLRNTPHVPVVTICEKDYQPKRRIRVTGLKGRTRRQCQPATIDRIAAEYLQSTRNRRMVQGSSSVLSPLHFRMSRIAGNYSNKLGTSRLLPSNCEVNAAVIPLGALDLETKFRLRCAVLHRSDQCALIATHELTRTIHHHLRRIGRVKPEPPNILLLPLCGFIQRKRITPAEVVPVRHMLAQHNRLYTRHKLLRIQLSQQSICWRTVRTSLRREQLDEHRNGLSDTVG
jgi:hypothetical protein